MLLPFSLGSGKCAKKLFLRPHYEAVMCGYVRRCILPFLAAQQFPETKRKQVIPVTTFTRSTYATVCDSRQNPDGIL